MPAKPTSFTEVVEALEAAHGKQPLPRLDPFERILWENVAYLANDAKRADAFAALKRRVGTRPEQVLAAPEDTLREIASAGILAHQTVRKLRTAAQIAVRGFRGDLWPILDWPPREAKKALRKFPAIGEPGAEKILLFARRLPSLAPESNGLRVLTRLGFGEVKKSYAATYRSAQEAVSTQVGEDYDLLIRAHLLLRRHGQEVCRSTPRCGECIVSRQCAYFRQQG